MASRHKRDRALDKKKCEIDIDPPLDQNEKLPPLPPRAKSRGLGCNLRSLEDTKDLYKRTVLSNTIFYLFLKD